MTRLARAAFLLLGLALLAMPPLAAHNLRGSVLDLGVFSHNLTRIWAHGEWQYMFLGHVQPVLAVFAALSALPWFPTQLAAAQAAFILWGLCIFPRIPFPDAQDKAWLGLAAMLFFPVWFNALFGFHLDHLMIPLGFGFYCFAFSRRWALAALCAACMALVKEPFSLCTVFCGLYLLARRKPAWGLALCLFGAGWFALATAWLIPAFSQAQCATGSVDAFTWLGDSPGAILATLFTHPMMVLGDILSTPDKLLYVAALLGSLALIPLLRPLELLPALPILGISLLSRHPGYYGLGHHYTAALVAPLLTAFALALPRARVLARGLGGPGLARAVPVLALTALLASNVALSPSPISRLFWTGKVWQYGLAAYLPDARNGMIERAVAEHADMGHDTVVSTQNTLFAPSMAGVRALLTFPAATNGVRPFEDFAAPGKMSMVRSDYVFLDLHRPWYLHDRGCSWRSGALPRLTGAELTQLGLEADPGPLEWMSCADDDLRRGFTAAVAEALQSHDMIFQDDGFMILKRRHDP